MPKTILITGYNGRVGKPFIEYLDNLETPYTLRLADLDIYDDERGIITDIADLEQCKTACQGVDMIIHLAANSSMEATFDEVLNPNIVGTYNIFEAAIQCDVRRVIFASSLHAVHGYPRDIQVKTDMPARPSNIYGVSKVFGEAMANYYAYQRNLEAIAVRIGAFKHQDEWEELSSRDLGLWADPDDLFSLFVQCLEVDLPEPFMIAHGISDNHFKRLDLSDTKQKLNYTPQFDSFAIWQTNFPDSSKRAQSD